MTSATPAPLSRRHVGGCVPPYPNPTPYAYDAEPNCDHKSADSTHR